MIRIKKSALTAMIKEELAKHISNLLEAEGGGVVDAESDANEKDAKKSPKKKKKDDQEVASDPEERNAKASEEENEPEPPSKRPVSPSKDGEPDEIGPEDTEEEDIPALEPGDEPKSDDELEKDVSGEDDGNEETGGIGDEIVGKTIQSMTMDPESEILPGAQEITVTFRDSPDPLKILITKTGQVKLFYHGGLHNSV